jgi:hypothetical protein
MPSMRFFTSALPILFVFACSQEPVEIANVIGKTRLEVHKMLGAPVPETADEKGEDYRGTPIGKEVTASLAILYDNDIVTSVLVGDVKPQISQEALLALVGRRCEAEVDGEDGKVYASVHDCHARDAQQPPPDFSRILGHSPAEVSNYLGPAESSEPEHETYAYGAGPGMYFTFGVWYREGRASRVGVSSPLYLKWNEEQLSEWLGTNCTVQLEPRASGGNLVMVKLPCTQRVYSGR